MTKQQPKRHPQNPDLRLHYDPLFNGQPVQTEKGPLITNYLESTEITLTRARYANARTFVTRFDLRFPQVFNYQKLNQSNNILATFWKNLDRLLARECVNYRNMRYVWAREIGETNGKPHFHCLLLIDANAIKSIGSLQRSPDGTYTERGLYYRLVRCWAHALNRHPAEVEDLVWFAKFPPPNKRLFQLVLSRDDHDGWNYLFYASSYLCKAETTPIRQGFHVFSTNRV